LLSEEDLKEFKHLTPNRWEFHKLESVSEANYNPNYAGAPAEEVVHEENGKTESPVEDFI